MTQKPPSTNVVIHIDRKQYKVTVDRISETDLRKLPEPDIGEQFDLWLEQPGQQDRKLNPGEVVLLRNGMHFTSVQRATNPG
jgi:hypothetical protein